MEPMSFNMHNLDNSQTMDSGALPSSPPADFVRQVQELYQHLSDLVYLRSHPLLDVLIPDPSIAREGQGLAVAGPPAGGH